MKKLIISALAIVAMVGCQKTDNLGSYEEGSVVRFSSLSLDTKLNDEGTQWIKGDTIGILSFNGDGFTSYSYFNEPYLADESTSSTSFSPAAEADVITYENQQDTRFYAYYPFSDKMTGDSDIPLDISDQSDIAKLDFMVSEPVTVEWDYANKSTDTDVEFEFKHKLSKIVMTVTARDDSESFLSDNLYTLLGDVQTTAKADIEGVVTPSGEKSTIELNTRIIDDSSAVVTAVLFPSESATYDLNFMLGDVMISTTFTDEFLVGKQYNYTVKVGNEYANFEGESSVVDWIDDEGEYSSSADYALGSIYNPQLITSREDFEKIGSDDASWSMSSHYKITQPIDFGGEAWTMIGEVYTDYFFGSIDGGNHALTNLYISNDGELSGLFVSLFGATMSNIYIKAPKMDVKASYAAIFASGSRSSKFINCVIEDCEIDVDCSTSNLEYIGGFICENDGSTQFYNCSITGDSKITVKGDNKAANLGGFCSYDYGSGLLLQGCQSSMDFSGNMMYIGGLVGLTGSSSTFTFDNCSATGSITNTGSDRTGGLVGSVSSKSSTIRDCVVESTISSAAYFAGGVIGEIDGSASSCTIEGTTVESAASVTGKRYVGGFIGFITTLPELTINNCQNKAAVTATYSSSTDDINAGGFIGSNYSVSVAATTTISNSVNEGSVTAESSASYVGGIIGQADCSNGTFTFDNVINRGDVSGNGYIAGILGGTLSGKAQTLHFTECLNEGNILATGSNVGGIAGYVDYSNSGITNTFKNCINRGDIESTYTFDTYVGGIVGYIYGMNNTTGCSYDISYCSNEGNITAYARVGGILGCLYYSDTAISYCTNYGEFAIPEGETQGSNMGGICGIVSNTWSENTNSIIINCSNNIVTMPNASPVGGIVGESSSKSGSSNNYTINCYSTAKMYSNNINNTGGVVGNTEESTLVACYTSQPQTCIYAANEISVTDCYYPSESSNIDVNCVALSTEYMKSANFATKLTNAAATYNATAADGFGIEACAWRQGSDGYPVLDF